MTNEPYLVAIDIGSHSIKLAVAKNSLDLNNKVQVLALVERHSSGIKKGVVTNMSEATEAIIEIVNQAESIIGLPIKQAIAGVGGINVGFTNSEGLIIISRSDNEITDSDIDRVIQDSLNKAFNVHNNEILHTIPRSFVLDNQRDIRYPVGMVGSKLECKTLIVSIEHSYLRNFTKVFNQAGLDIAERIFTPLASGEFLLTQRQKRAGTVLVDIGYASTTFIIWEDEEILGSGVIPIGSDHVTSDLAVGLQTSMEMAEEIKKQYLDFTQIIKDNEEIEMFNPDLKVNEVFRLREIQEYARPRVEEIFSFLNKELKKVNRSSQLPGGAVLLGGGSSLAGITEIAKGVLKLPIFKYSFDHNTVDFVPDYNDDPAFMNCIALAAYALHHGEEINQSQKYSGNFQGPTIVGDHPEKGNGFLAFLKKMLPWS